MAWSNPAGNPSQQLFVWAVMLKVFVYLCVGGVMGALKYVVIGVVVVVVVVATAMVLLLPTLHRVPVQYVGSPSGYEVFVPNGECGDSVVTCLFIFL